MVEIFINPGDTLKFLSRDGKLIMTANSDFTLNLLREDLSNGLVE
jgi:hypothetical protein